MRKFSLLLFVFFTSSLSVIHAQEAEMPAPQKDSLVVLWSSGDPDVADKVCFMYTYNAKKQGWFDDVTLIIWGPSAKLLAETDHLQDYVEKMMEAGVHVEACVACARMYGVDDDLREMGIDVKGMGVPLTDYLKKDYAFLNF